MKKIFVIIFLTCLLAISGCSKSVPQQTKDVKSNESAQQVQADADISSMDKEAAKDTAELADNEKPDMPAKDTPVQDPFAQEKPCLKATKPFCEVIVSEGECDPKLNEYHYKAGDFLYWINHTQYDTVDCYYTEEEYNKYHDPKDCDELQDEGRGCIIDDSPECNLMLCEDCTVCFTRASCDERLLELGKDVGDRMPGVWIKKDNKTECFYTEEEREQFLKKNKLECEKELGDEEHICTATAMHPTNQ